MPSSSLEQIKKALRNMFRRNKNQDGTRQKVQQSSPGVYQDHPATKPTTGESTWSGRPMKSTGNGQEDNAPAPPPKPTISQMVEARSDKHLAGAVSPVSEKELVTVATPSPKPAPPPTVLGGRMGGGGPINAVREKFSRLPSAPSTPVHSQQPVGAWDPVSSSSNAASNVAKNTPTTFQAELPGSEGTKLEAELNAEARRDNATPVDSANTPHARHHFDEKIPVEGEGPLPPTRKTLPPAMQATSGPLQDWFPGA